MFARRNLSAKPAPAWEKPLLACATLLIPVLCVGCANPGPPRPPSLHLPEPAQNLTAERVGPAVQLSWTTPSETTDGETLAGTISAVICRQDIVLPVVAQHTAPCNPVQRISVTAGPAHTRVELPPALRTGPVALLGFEVELLNQQNRSTGLSATAYTTAGQAPPAAGSITVSPLRNAVQITWQAAATDAPIQLSRRLIPAAGAPPAKPAKKAGPKHQQDKTTPGQAILNLPPSHTDPGGMIDRGIRDGDTLAYTAQRVRNVTFSYTAPQPGPVSGKAKKHREPAPASVTVELRGEPSPPVTLAFHDVAPPAVPTGLAAVPGGGFGAAPSIDLSWEPNSEADLLGYNLYRADAGGSFTRLNPEPVPGTAFRDLTAQPGHAYSYHVTAVDQRHNESAPSTPLEQQLNRSF